MKWAYAGLGYVMLLVFMLPCSCMNYALELPALLSAHVNAQRFVALLACRPSSVSTQTHGHAFCWPPNFADLAWDSSYGNTAGNLVPAQ